MAQNKFLELNPELYRYLVEQGAGQNDLLRELAAETEALGSVAVMQVAPEQGALFTLLVGAIGARRALEIGTFTGYSAICIARGLPADGELVCCESNAEYAAVARRYFEAAGVAERIELRIGDAAETLRSLPIDAAETLRSLPIDAAFDFAFVDADKVSYPIYYEETLKRLRPGGLMVLDNMLLGGRVLEPAIDDRSAQTVRRLNAEIATDDRVEHAMVAVADGITIIRKLA